MNSPSTSGGNAFFSARTKLNGYGFTAARNCASLSSVEKAIALLLRSSLSATDGRFHRGETRSPRSFGKRIKKRLFHRLCAFIVQIARDYAHVLPRMCSRKISPTRGSTRDGKLFKLSCFAAG